MAIDRQRHPRMRTLASPPLRRIAVVIPAHNERDRLPRCLASVAAAADRVDVPVEVLVVLDSCTDGSEDAIPLSVRTVRASFRNVGTARAAGCAAASSADHTVWLATTDADSVVPTTWLADQVAHHRRRVQGVVGTVSVDWQEHSPVTQRAYDRHYRIGGRSHGHVHGANLGIRADAYWRVGGFRPLRVGEDVDLVDRLISARVPIAWDDRNPVLTSDRRDSRATGGFGDFVRSLADDLESGSSAS